MELSGPFNSGTEELGPQCHASGLALVALIVMSSLARVCEAQDAQQLEVDELPAEVRELLQGSMARPRVSPGVAFGSPMGFGASGGDYFFGVNGATSPENPNAPGDDNDFIGDLALDGSMAAGFGIDDPRRNVGIEVAVNVTSLTDQFGDSGAVAIKVHRAINAGRA